MRILIGTPCAGGLVNQTYMTSVITEVFLQEERLKQQAHYNVGLYTLANESLISRGRNHIAQVALTQGWDRLIFIDADVSWTWPQFKSVIDNCDAKQNRGVVAGSCPLKTFPIRLNFMPYNDDEKFFPDYLKTAEGMVEMALSHGSPLIPVPYIGTAFMCIDVQVLRDLAPVTPWYTYPDPITHEDVKHWDFFPVGPIKNQFVSEDWGFCHIAREFGHSVYLDSDVIVNHTGPHTYSVQIEEVLKNVSEKRERERIANVHSHE